MPRGRLRAVVFELIGETLRRLRKESGKTLAQLGSEAQVGKGRLFIFGPEITFRAQPHGTFKLLFNGIYYGPAISGAPSSSSPTAAQ